MEQNINIQSNCWVSTIAEEYRERTQEAWVNLRQYVNELLKEKDNVGIKEVIIYHLKNLFLMIIWENSLGGEEDLEDIISNGIWETVQSMDRNGKTYDQFLEDILKKNDIEITEEQKKYLVMSYKRYISGFNPNSFIQSICAYRMQHDAVADKNSGEGGYIFPAISDYELASYEFDFYMKKHNQSEMLGKELVDKIREASGKRLYPYFGNNLKRYLNSYRKLLSTPLEQLTEEEIELLFDIIEKKIEFIHREQTDKLLIMAEWSVYNYLNIDKVTNSQANQRSAIVLYEIIGRLLADISYDFEREEFNEEIYALFIDAIIDLGNELGQESWKRKTLIFKNRYHNGLFQYWRQINKLSPTFSVPDNLDILEENFIKNLKENDAHLEDFIQLAFFTNNRMCTDEQSELIAKRIRIIFMFLNECQKKKANSGDANLNIGEELKKLEQRLRETGADISFDYFEKSYDGEGFQEYFPKRYKFRYEDLLVQLDKIADGEDNERVIERYLNYLLIKRGKKWVVLQREKERLGRDLLGRIVSCLFPNRLSQIEDYELKYYVAAFVKKYKLNLGI